ncbi:MAG: Gx transporter family protein, partial [Lachnospiraceae bacterium]|nr:Gx transporter family protein [Lachnospiraceae bacterium]
GAFCSFLVMFMLHKFRFGLLGISSGGGISHNIGQLVVAAFVVETWNILYYGPVLLIFGIVTGLLNGFICSLLLPYLKKMQKGS